MPSVLRVFGIGLPRGARGERIAARHLKRLGHRILARNLRTRFGEVDLLSRDRDGTIVVTEVKTGTLGQTPPEARVNAEKRRKLVALATQLARRHGFDQARIRFDVVAVELPRDGVKGKPAVRHYVNAFSAGL